MLRDKIIHKLYDISRIPYAKLSKRQPAWPIQQQDLLSYASDSLGFHLACFLQQHQFEIQPKLENHDVFHVLTRTGVTVCDEISLQYYLLGNGKRSMYLWLVVLLGGLLYPRQWPYFKAQYRKGQRALKFYDLSFLALLHLPVGFLRRAYRVT